MKELGADVAFDYKTTGACAGRGSPAMIPHPRSHGGRAREGGPDRHVRAPATSALRAALTVRPQILRQRRRPDARRRAHGREPARALPRACAPRTRRAAVHAHARRTQICGMISGANTGDYTIKVRGPCLCAHTGADGGLSQNLNQIIGRSIAMHGFIVTRLAHKYGAQFYAEVPALLADGTLRCVPRARAWSPVLRHRKCVGARSTGTPGSTRRRTRSWTCSRARTRGRRSWSSRRSESARSGVYDSCGNEACFSLRSRRW
jgi:hypothetical protein